MPSRLSVAGTLEAMASTTSRRLEDLSGPEITERITESSVIVQPIGAVEQTRPAPSPGR